MPDNQAQSPLMEDLDTFVIGFVAGWLRARKELEANGSERAEIAAAWRAYDRFAAEANAIACQDPPTRQQ